jgi:hypothetical protein
MSPFMSSMPPADLIETPPESKTTPLPTRASGGSERSGAPFQRITTMRGSRAEPCATARIAPMLSARIRSGSITSTSTPRRVSSAARRANSSGKSTFGGSLMRSRASTTPSATASLARAAASAPAGSASIRVRLVPPFSSASGFFLVL